MLRIMVILTFAFWALSGLWAQPPEAMISFEKLDNQAIMKMVRDGIPDRVIVSEIESTEGEFDTSASAIEELKKSGVSEEVITAMVQAAARPGKAEAPPGPPPPPAPARPAEESPVAAAEPERPRPSVAAEPSDSVVTPDPPPAVSESPVSTPVPPPAAPPAPTVNAEPVAPSVPSPAPPSVPAAASDPRPSPPGIDRIERRERLTPRLEVFGGYTYWLAERGPNVPGWNASVTANVTRYFGVVTDFSRQSENRNALGIDFGNINTYRILAGPQLALRGGVVTGFVRGLLGGGHTGTLNRNPASWHMAYSLGGGVDVRLASGLALRPVQWDAVFTDQPRETRTDHRLSFGAVARF